LANEDFEELNRVKALGFLHILKREYDIDTDSLERSIKSYFEGNIKSSEVSVDGEDDDKRKRRGLPKGVEKWLFGSLLAMALWYLYSSGKLKQIVSGKSDSDINISLLNSDVNSSNIDTERLENSIKIKRDENRTEIEIDTSLNPNRDRNSTAGMEIVTDIPDGNGSKEMEIEL